MILNARVTNLSLFIECLPSKNIDVFSEAEPLNEKISKHRILLIIRINLTFSLQAFTSPVDSLDRSTKFVSQAKRLTHSKVKQANPDTGSKQHCEVCQVIEVWFVIGFSKFHFAILREVEHNNKQKPYILGANVHPCKDLCNPQHPFRHLSVSDIGLDSAPNYKEPDDCSGQKSHHRVEAQEDT